MSDLKVEAIDKINSRDVDVYSIRHVLTASGLTETQKAGYIRAKSTEIKNVLANKLTDDEYNFLMDNRSLDRFKPIKNSFTKKGDKILLAQNLNIPVNEVDNYINQAVEMMKKDTNNLFFNTNFSAIKTYVYRHGTQDQLLTTFNTELANSKNIINTLTKELKVGNSSIAGYYDRPIHRMSNKTLVQLYNVVDQNLSNAAKVGQISTEQANEFSEWALAKIYHMQYRSQMISAFKAPKKV